MRGALLLVVLVGCGSVDPEPVPLPVDDAGADVRADAGLEATVAPETRPISGCVPTVSAACKIGGGWLCREPFPRPEGCYVEQDAGGGDELVCCVPGGIP